MSNYELITSKKQELWLRSLVLCNNYDTYDLPGYHILANELGEGSPYLFFFQSDNQYAALPFLLRPVAEVKGLENVPYMDAISVYGYPGILSSVKVTYSRSSDFRAEFQNAIIEALKKLNCITLFIRFNPLIDNSWLFEGMGDLELLGETVAIYLKQSEAEQMKSMRNDHRYGIRKARRNGVIAKEDISFTHIESFIAMYDETMDRTGAKKYYYFPKSYYLRLKALLGDSLKLFFAEKDGLIISASLFLVTNNIVQYHLSGTPTEYLKLSGTKVILDEVRKWATERGCSWFHLGGGLGSKRDTLFEFKAGFSKSRFSFKVLRLIVESSIYDELIQKTLAYESEKGNDDLSDDYFPKYRRPINKDCNGEAM